jgi:hypothetical protein
VEGSGKLTGSMLMGTPAFVSPEQAQGKGLDHRSDQYSLGVVLYLIATGHLPFDTDSPMALVLMHIQDPVPKPSRFNPALKPALERVILKTLAKDLEERFKDTADLKRAYHAALAGDSVAWVEAPTELLPARRAAPVDRRGGKRPFPTWLIPASALPVVALLAVIAFGPGAANEGPAGTPTGLAGLGVATRVPASTALPTASPAPTLTPTPVEAGACPGLRLIAFSKKGNEVSWTIDNGTGSSVQLTGLAFKWPENNPANLISLAGQVWLKKEDLEQMILDMEQGRNPAIPFDQRMNIADGVIRTLTLRFNWPVDDEAGIYRLELGIDSGPGACVLETQW